MTEAPNPPPPPGLLRAIQRNAWLFLGGSFLLGFGMSVMWTFFNLYLREGGQGEAVIGTLLSANSLGAVVISIPAAYAMGRMRIKTLLILSNVLVFASYCVALLTFHRVALLAAFFFAGMFLTSHWVAGAPFFMRNSSPRERPYLFGWSFGVEMLASMLGAFLGGYAVKAAAHLLGTDLLGYKVVLFGGALTFLGGVVPYSLIEEKKLSKEALRPLNHFLTSRDWSLLGKLTFPSFLIGLGAGLVIPFLNLYFKDRFTVPVESIGLYFALSSGLIAAGNFAGPWLARRIGLLRTVAFSQLLSIPFILVLAYATRVELAILAFLLRSALMNMGHPMANNFAMEVVTREEQAVTNSINSLAWNASWMVSTVVGGLVIERFGYVPSFLVTAALYLASTLLYLAFFWKAEYLRLGTEGAGPEVADQGSRP